MGLLKSMQLRVADKIKYFFMSEFERLIADELNPDERFLISHVIRPSDKQVFAIGTEVIFHSIESKSKNLDLLDIEIQKVMVSKIIKIQGFKEINGVMYALFDHYEGLKKKLSELVSVSRWVLDCKK